MEFFESVITPRAIELAAEALRSGWVGEGRRVAEFERALSDLGVAHPVAVNSGTSALHLSLAIAGVAQGDEVILPAQTFLATGLAIMHLGAKPVFADIDPASGCIDSRSVEGRITERTKALMPVHWGGYPCELDELNAIAARHGLALVEDAAHAFGASYRARPIGAVSRFTCFSFQAIKHVTTGDGGAVCCLDADDSRSARRRRWFGIDRDAAKPSLLGEREFDVKEVGYKYHMNDIAAAIGLGNLEGFAARLARRRAVAARYRKELKDVAGITLLANAADRASSCWLFTLRVERREAFVRKLADEGIPASVVHRRIDRLTVFGGMRPDLPGQDLFDASQISLPAHSGLSDDDVDRVVRAIRAGW
jgi:perosamine synthetase